MTPGEGRAPTRDELRQLLVDADSYLSLAVHRCWRADCGREAREEATQVYMRCRETARALAAPPAGPSEADLAILDACAAVAECEAELQRHAADTARLNGLTAGVGAADTARAAAQRIARAIRALGRGEAERDHA